MKYLVVLSLLLCNFFTFATVRVVPTQYSSIQSALDSSMPGDTISVMPGIYYENIVWPNIPALKLISQGDTTNTIIDGNHLNTVLKFHGLNQVHDTNTIVQGFKIRNGYLQGSPCHGAGIALYNATAKFVNIQVTQNSIHADDWGFGAGVYLSGSASLFYNSSISENIIDSATWGFGGGIYLDSYTSPKFVNVMIKNNSVTSDIWNFGAGIYAYKSNATFINIIVSGNIEEDGGTYYQGAGICLEESQGSITNALVCSNVMGNGGNYYNGGGISCSGYYFEDSVYVITMKQVTVTNNYRANGGNIIGNGLDCEQADSLRVDIINSIFYNSNPASEISNWDRVNMTYSLVKGGFPGIGNFNGNPLFVSAIDFHLAINSPCINHGTLLGAPTFDLENNPRPMPLLTNPDMGCYEESFSVGIHSPENTISTVRNFPNPFSDNTTIQYYLDKPGNITIEIIDMNGKLIASYNKTIYASGNQTFELNTRDFRNGAYQCRIRTANTIQTIKLVKI